MKTLRITVTQEHIDKGTPRDTNSCPIALAFIDSGYYNVGIGNTVAVSWHFNGTDYVTEMDTDLPGEACDFIRDFDADQEVAPFSFSVTRFRKLPIDADDEGRNS